MRGRDTEAVGEAELVIDVQNRLAVEAARHGDVLWKLRPSDRAAFDAEMSLHQQYVTKIIDDYVNARDAARP